MIAILAADVAPAEETVRATDASDAAAASPSPTPPYPPTAERPTQTAPRGVVFDFNMGARVLLPPVDGDSPPWRVLLRDQDTGNILFQSENRGAFVRSSKRWFVRFRVEVRQGVDVVLSHDFDARERDVLIQFPVGTLGDTLAWFPYAVRFAERWGCRLTCAMSGLIIPLLRDAYPAIHFVTHEDVVEQALAGTFYATYSLGLFFDDAENIWQPTDFRQVGLHRTAGYILGVGPDADALRLSFADPGPPIPEPYVCIAVQASTQAKHWTNPHGWREVVQFLKDSGYRVVCIDQKPVHGTGLVWNHVPHGVEDETGDRPLAERARWLKHAAFFVGLSSGLAWLAWAAGCPVVLISGFTHPVNEFPTPFRVINWHVCNSCWNDVRHRFDHKDFLWCPRQANTPRQFECTRLITADHVRNAIRCIPGFTEGAIEMS